MGQEGLGELGSYCVMGADFLVGERRALDIDSCGACVTL